MSTDLQLFHRIADREGERVGVLPLATEILEKALGMSALVPRVGSAAEQERAVEAQKALKEYLQIVESSRKFIKAPALAFCAMVEETARKITEEAKSEMNRLSALVGVFQDHEDMKRRAAEAGQFKDLEEIERKRFEELAQAKSPDEEDFIQHKYDVLARALPVIEPSRVEGQTVTHDWEITVIDKWLLARAHPSCVEIVPRVSEIKALLKAGVKVVGIIAKPITKSNVRVKKGKVLEV